MKDAYRLRFFLLVATFIIVLAGTNAATYLLLQNREQPGELIEEPRTIIRYQKERDDNGPDNDLDMAIFWETIDSLTNKYFYPVEEETLIEGAVRGMIEIIEDPQVRFYDPDALEEFLTDTKGSYGGIGIRIIEANNSIVIFETLPKTPAERSGLSPGDRILEADGHELTGQGINRAVELLRGPENTVVDIIIKRPGADEPIALTVDREEIKVETVSSEMVAEGLGYIKISSFDANTAAEFNEQFRQLEQSGLGKGLILDLRNNPGGLMDQAVEVAKQLVPEGEIVRLVGRDDDVRSIYYSSAAKKPYLIVALINEESASASELLAGALQDREAGLLVGKKTFGKASVQQLEYLSGGNALVLTVANYFTPSGRNIDKHGIEPDHEVDMPEILNYYRYFHPNRLERGDYGPEVEMLQHMLELIGFMVEASGYFDAQTYRAISDFQGLSGLDQSGIFDDVTWVELREALDIAAREQDQQLNYAIELFY